MLQLWLDATYMLPLNMLPTGARLLSE